MCVWYVLGYVVDGVVAVDFIALSNIWWNVSSAWESMIMQITHSIPTAHLYPLPLQAKPVYWDLDYTLRLFPLPHLLVLADHAEQFEYMYKGCNTVNPGELCSDGVLCAICSVVCGVRLCLC